MDATQLKGPSINPSAVAEVAWKSKIFDRLALEALVRLLLLLVKKLSRLSSRFWSPVGRDPINIKYTYNSKSQLMIAFMLEW